jgi:hypothetical protein
MNTEGDGVASLSHEAASMAMEILSTQENDADGDCMMDVDKSKDHVEAPAPIFRESTGNLYIILL